MPIFLDAHHGAELPLDSVRDFLRAARRGTADQFGLRPLDLYCADEGRVFYVIAAPDEAAIRRSHAHHGAICRRVRRVQPPGPVVDVLGDREKAIVRRMILAEQSDLSRPASRQPGDGSLRHAG